MAQVITIEQACRREGVDVSELVQELRAVAEAPTARNVGEVPTARNVGGAPTARNVGEVPTARNVAGAPTARNMIARGKREARRPWSSEIN
jgi:hypothetical protein